MDAFYNFGSLSIAEQDRKISNLFPEIFWKKNKSSKERMD